MFNILISNISTTSALLQLNGFLLTELINQKKKQQLIFTSILSNKKKRIRRLQNTRKKDNKNREVVGSSQGELICGGKI